ncbi:MAG TPA: hypothetical protein VGD37_16295 [Kofleriaceae bacterium]|jgi:hypothetical protein
MLFRVLTRAAGLLGLACWVGCSGCGDDGGFDAGQPDTPAGGSFSLAWSLVDDSGTTSCTNVAACCNKLDPNATVFVQASRTGTGGVELFSCRSVQGTSMTAFAPGTYNFTYDLRIPVGDHNETIATATPQNSVMLASGTSVGLTPITFHVNLTGGLTLMLQAGAAGTKNCTGGAEISGFAISLEHAGGPGDTGCAPVVFALSGGGSYSASTCSAPSTGRCIESTETLTVASLPSGPYQIHVRGKKKGTLDCWTNDDMFAVPPQGRSLVRTLNLAFASTNPGCQ